VLSEAFRVLRPGGLFAVSDVVVRGGLAGAARETLESWVGCVAGALEEDEYRAKLESVGFADVSLQVTRVHDPAELASCACGSGDESDYAPDPDSGQIVSAFVRARKPDAR
jgi:hypothetical protein